MNTPSPTGHAVTHDDAAGHPAPQSFLARYVWSQDHKVIAVQYACTAIAVGVVGLIGSQSPKSIGSAVTTMGMGVWMAAAVNHWYDLGWGSSWPLALVAAGLGALAEWAASVVAARREGEEHVG